ncbi:MAG: FtsX-like permease family protein [Candidatus Sericytochromatia bacterium]|nr:FtsX-like permease family protein [Candidatus Sericytochromatia bacterium]
MNKIIFKTSQKIFKRDKEKLFLSFASLFIGALVLTVILGLVNSVKTYINTQSKELIGGDIVIQQSFPIEINKSDVLQNLIKKGATYTTRIQTLVNFSDKSNKQSVLSSVKAVGQNHPLYGKVETRLHKNSLPKDDEIYAEESLFDKLNIKVGETVLVNKVKFKAADIIEREPDRFGSGFSFGPKVIMTSKGWENTKINKEASRITYYVSVKIPTEIYKDEEINKIEKVFKNDGAQVTTSKKGPTQLINIVDAWEKFFLAVTVLTLFLIMVNIRSNLIYLLSYFTKTISVFRVLGMKQKDIISIFTILLLIISTAGGLIGNMIGNSIIYLLMPYLEKIVRVSLPRPYLVENILMVTIFTIALCFVSSISAFLKILQIEPKMVLANNIQTKSTFKSVVREIITSLLIILGLFLGIYYLTEKIYVALISVGAISVIFLFFILLIKGLIALIYKKKFSFSFSIRSIINFVRNQGIVGETALASLTLALASIFCIALIQYNISENLQGPLRAKLPNLYVIDVQEDQVKPVKIFFKNKINLFPNIRARLAYIDDRDIQGQNEDDTENNQAITKDNNTNEELKREFNLTYRTELIEGEKLVSGVWHGTKDKNSVSIEKRFADRADIKLGSEVEFLILGVSVKAKVTSIRTVDPSQGLPFFFFVFSPDVIKDAPQSFFGYTSVPDKQISKIQTDLIRKFPNLFVLPTNEIIKTITEITNTIITAVLTVSIPSLILGILLIFAMLINSARERFRDLLVFKVFGATQNKVFKMYLLETLFFIGFSSSFALTFALAATFTINKYFFKFQNYYFNNQIFAIVLIVLVFAIAFSIYLIRRMFVKTPSVLFRS